MDMDRINALTTQIADARAVLDDLTKQLEEIKTEKKTADMWKPNKGDRYYVVDSGGIYNYEWANDDVDNALYKKYNVWRTEEHAKDVIEKIGFLRLTEQIHDVLCPDYKSDWSKSAERKYYLVYDYIKSAWVYHYACTQWAVCTFFDTEEHAKQACEMLNSMNIAGDGDEFI